MNGQTSKEANRWTQFAKTGLSNAQSALAAAMGLEHELLNRKEQQKWDPNRGTRPDRQRLSLISCIFGLNSF